MISPDRNYRASFTEAIAEFESVNGEGDGGLTTEVLARDTTAFLQYLTLLSTDPKLNARHQWWWCDTAEQVYIARVTLSLRDDLDRLEIVIRPRFWGQGHFTRIVGAVMPVAKSLGVDVERLSILTAHGDDASKAELALIR